MTAIESWAKRAQFGAMSSSSSPPMLHRGCVCPQCHRSAKFLFGWKYRTLISQIFPAFTKQFEQMEVSIVLHISSDEDTSRGKFWYFEVGTHDCVGEGRFIPFPLILGRQL